MDSKLIIIRGNSGSGKSSIAKALREKMGDKTMLVQQDVIRREMLFVKDRPDNPAVNLILKNVLYGKEIGYNVILEGILKKDMYGEMIAQLESAFTGSVNIYYLDVSFEETLRRHETKSVKDEFGPDKMREWWIERDVVGSKSERILTEELSQFKAVQQILDDIDYFIKK